MVPFAGTWGDEMDIQIDRSSSTPVYLQIRNQIREKILSGELPAAFRLPPERSLAEMLGVNRSTVLNAYRELKADALIISRIGQGTVVSGESPQEIHPVDMLKREPISWRQFFSRSAARAREPLLRDLMELTGRKDVISFAAGISPPELYPMDSLQRVYERMMREGGPSVLLHCPTEGHYPLRESIAQLLKGRGIDTSAEEVIILSGSQQGLEIASRVFVDPGDIVIVEEPSFFCALQIFEAAGARLLSVPVDENGMRMDILEQLLTRYKPKLIYTMPTFQNPTGVVMDLQRRHQLLNIAYKYNVPILEDDPYGELRYEGRPLLPLKALDQHGYVMYLSTFSKVLFPGLRIGWMTAPRGVIRQFAYVKQNIDLHSNSISQWLLDGFIRENLLADHIERMKREYLLRRNKMLEALEQYALPGICWNRPRGGLYLWCRLPEQTAQSKLIARAGEYKVAFVPGSPFFVDNQGENYVRLNFSFSSREIINEGILRLMKAVEAMLVETGGIDKRKEYEIVPIV